MTCETRHFVKACSRTTKHSTQRKLIVTENVYIDTMNKGTYVVQGDYSNGYLHLNKAILQLRQELPTPFNKIQYIVVKKVRKVVSEFP